MHILCFTYARVIMTLVMRLITTYSIPVVYVLLLDTDLVLEWEDIHVQFILI